MEHDFRNALHILMNLPEDISIESVGANPSSGCAIVKIEHEGNYLPAVFAFRMMRLGAFKPLRLDFYSRKVEASLLGLLSVQEGALDYNMALSIPLPYYNHEAQANKIRRLIKSHAVL